MTELLNLWPELIAYWRALMEAAWYLNWGVAVQYLPALEDKSLKFMHLAQVRGWHTHTHTHIQGCAPVCMLCKAD